MRRHAALIRVLTFFFLLRIGVDFGAHGLLASDFAPIAAGGSSARLAVDASAVAPCGAPDHCFCHGLSVGAVPPVSGAVPSLIGQAVVLLSQKVPQTDRHPLDQPPRLTAQVPLSPVL